MAQEILFSDETLSISYDDISHIICMDWKGAQNLETVKNGCEQLIACLQKVDCHKVLNDNTNVHGSWSEASEWAALNCMPRLQKTGLQYIAWVYSPSTFSKLSADETLNLNKSVVAVTFQDVAAARKWLEQV